MIVTRQGRFPVVQKLAVDQPPVFISDRQY
jgi:hypothetical protein